jgi:hypothetical protein
MIRYAPMSGMKNNSNADMKPMKKLCGGVVTTENAMKKDQMTNANPTVIDAFSKPTS